MNKHNSLKGIVLDFYQKLDPKNKQQVILIGGITLVLLVSFLIISATSDDTEIEPRAKKAKKIEYSMFNKQASPREVSVDALAASLKVLTKDMADMRLGYSKQQQALQEEREKLDRQKKDQEANAALLKQQVEELKGKLTAAQSVLENQVPLPPLTSKSKLNRTTQGNSPGSPPSVNSTDTNVDAGGIKIRVITLSGEEGKKKTGSGGNVHTTTLANSTELEQQRKAKLRILETVNIKKNNPITRQPDFYLPAGSILSGTMVSGLDAPTSNQSRQDPFPALLRLKHEAFLPNFYKMDISECFVIASGYGDLSSERAYLRAERISCIKKDGTVIETPMDAYSVGEDGKTGVRGRVVSKNGQIIGNALLAGFVSGLGKAFTPQRVQPLSLNPSGTQQFQYPSPEMVGGQAIGGGVHEAANQIASYYLEMARNIFPVVEIDAGRKIDLILVRGMSLVPKSRSSSILTERNMASGSFSNARQSSGSGIAGINFNSGSGSRFR